MGAAAPTAQASDYMSDNDAHRLVLLGGGEHASVVADAAKEQTWELVGFAAPDATTARSIADLAYLGDDSTFSTDLAAMPAGERPALVIAFGGVDATPAR